MDKYLKGIEKHQQMMDKLAGRNSVFAGIEKQQQMMDKLAGRNSVFAGIEKQQQMMDKLAGRNSVFVGIEKQQQMMDRLVGSNPVFARIEKQQQMMDKLAGRNSIFARIEKQQQMMDRLAGRNSVFAGIEKHQQMMDRLIGSNSIFERIEKQQKMMEDFLISPIKNTFKAETFQFGDGLVIVDNFLEKVHSDLNSSQVADSNKNNQELLDWLKIFLENCMILIYRLQNVCNTINTKQAAKQLWGLINIVSTTLTVISFLQGDTTEIHIHNKYEDVNIEMESNRHRTDIYIEKNDSFNEDERVKEEQWFSAGERT